MTDAAGIAPSQCTLCRYRDGGNPAVCTAFPRGIPVAIRLNARDHREPIEGDGGIRFAPRDDADPDSLAALVADFDRPRI